MVKFMQEFNKQAVELLCRYLLGFIVPFGHDHDARCIYVYDNTLVFVNVCMCVCHTSEHA